MEVVRLLLEAGASPHKGCEGSPPLHIAVCTGGQPGQEQFADEAARLLLARGAMPYDRCVPLAGAAGCYRWRYLQGRV